MTEMPQPGDPKENQPPNDSGESTEAQIATGADVLFKFVADRMKAGDDKHKIIKQAEELGYKGPEITRLIEKLYNQIIETALKERVTGGVIQKGVMGGITAALACGIAWAFIIVVTGYELGIAAWGIGFVVGYAVVKFAGGAKGTPLQITAAVCAVLSILIGKYATFVYYATGEMAEGFDFGVFFQPEVIQLFFENINEVAGGFDILWVILAVASAWKIPAGSGIEPPPNYQSPFTMPH